MLNDILARGLHRVMSDYFEGNFGRPTLNKPDKLYLKLYGGGLTIDRCDIRYYLIIILSARDLSIPSLSMEYL